MADNLRFVFCGIRKPPDGEVLSEILSHVEGSLPGEGKEFSRGAADPSFVGAGFKPAPTACHRLTRIQKLLKFLSIKSVKIREIRG